MLFEVSILVFRAFWVDRSFNLCRVCFHMYDCSLSSSASSSYSFLLYPFLAKSFRCWNVVTASYWNFVFFNNDEV